MVILERKGNWSEFTNTHKGDKEGIQILEFLSVVLFPSWIGLSLLPNDTCCN
ncbi:hypothetical protein TanjilG_00231 [Lupinus angustifolius]|uniref:Uncharacterized protein n=1 Tax=Lupinus angustifolius TaxID=3871 RepID=A0A394DDM1_LUPAN|nr:hypothetical protein TanjilG_00231 [Lupinus angustifolius]